MITTSLIRKLAEEKTEGTQVFVLDVNIRKGNKILITLDGDQGVTIDDCVALSRHIESKLDRDEEDFELQVSSAGADKPLRMPRQYKQHLGRTLRVHLVDESFKTGILKEVKPGSIELEIIPPGGKNKLKNLEEPHKENIVFDVIKESTVIITF
jgi:ribosome maturation factor RimP